MLAQAMGFARVESGRIVSMVVEAAIGIWVLFLFVLAVAWAPVDRRLGSQARRDLEFFPEPGASGPRGATDDFQDVAPAPAGAGERSQADD
jgi:hypothetical protein